ncbi:MAG: hypothetical protein WCE46_04745 [Methanoregula sp.]|uniref:hypothetical protein n=1 Tax=Methanoregula sp. TaxID=2052170 RepID=UPI003C7878EB
MCDFKPDKPSKTDLIIAGAAIGALILSGIAIYFTWQATNTQTEQSTPDISFDYPPVVYNDTIGAYVDECKITYKERGQELQSYQGDIQQYFLLTLSNKLTNKYHFLIIPIENYYPSASVYVYKPSEGVIATLISNGGVETEYGAIRQNLSKSANNYGYNSDLERVTYVHERYTADSKSYDQTQYLEGKGASDNITDFLNDFPQSNTPVNFSQDESNNVTLYNEWITEATHH